MSLPIWGLKTAEDMWRKAKRELDRYESKPSVDHAFNFLVTIFHIRDYAQAQKIPVDAMDINPDFKLCRLACAQGKHLVLCDEDLRAIEVNRGIGYHNDASYPGPERCSIIADGIRIDISNLGRCVLSAWADVLGISAS